MLFGNMNFLPVLALKKIPTAASVCTLIESTQRCGGRGAWRSKCQDGKEEEAVPGGPGDTPGGKPLLFPLSSAGSGQNF